jgi:hypothetical protein
MCLGLTNVSFLGLNQDMLGRIFVSQYPLVLDWNPPSETSNGYAQLITRHLKTHPWEGVPQ